MEFQNRVTGFLHQRDIHGFTRRFFIACFGTLLAVSLIIYPARTPQCQTSDSFNMRAQVTDSGGGSCRSATRTLVFSMGQTAAVGISQSDGRSLSAGFITSAGQLADGNDANGDDTETDNVEGDDTEADDAEKSDADADDTDADGTEKSDTDADDTGTTGDSSAGGCFIGALITGLN